ncbi:MAG TPA: peptidyl-prolyl cis-trans isomerase [Candidatus Fermentibacter sp.]|nr:peptidyl-prolyl cis-trans isomerase [Candidatus Fermentibacter sp.]
MKELVVVSAFLVAMTAGCGTPGVNTVESDSTVVLATVGDVEITMQTLRQELDLIPPYQRASFETPEGQRVLLDHLVERELLLQAAEEAGLESDSFVQAQVELAMQQVELTRQRALIQVFYENNVVNTVVVPDSEIIAYYGQHTGDIYFRSAQVHAYMILAASPATIEAALAEIEAGQPFDSVAVRTSEHAPTASLGGDLGWITADSPMPYLGAQEEMTAALFAASAGDIVGPFDTDLGTVILRVAEKVEEGARPLEEVRESIINTLKPSMVNTYYRDQLLPGLRERYAVSINEEAFLPGPDVPADSLMMLAQSMMESNPETAITYFKLFLERFPEDSTAYQAAFLVGFTYSEYLRDYESARTAFSDMIERFPASELTDDAQWMLENMETPIDSLIPVEGQPAQGN